MKNLYFLIVFFLFFSFMFLQTQASPPVPRCENYFYSSEVLHHFTSAEQHALASAIQSFVLLRHLSDPASQEAKAEINRQLQQFAHKKGFVGTTFQHFKLWLLDSIQLAIQKIQNEPNPHIQTLNRLSGLKLQREKLQKLLLKYETNDVQTAFSKCAHENKNSQQTKIKEMQILLAFGANIDNVDLDKNTILLKAIWTLQFHVAQFLIRQGANLQIKSLFGQTALRAAVTMHSPELVQLLLENGASKDEQYSGGWSALMQIAASNDVEIASLLIQAGANLNLRTNDGDTALILASQSGAKEMVQLLISAGADPRIKNSEGITALSSAKNLEVSNLIKHYLKQTRVPALVKSVKNTMGIKKKLPHLRNKIVYFLD